MKRTLSFLLLLFVALTVTAQTREWTLLHQGNRAFRNGAYKEAENYYRRALEENPRSARAAFNLGDAYLAQKNAKDALQQFVNAAQNESNRVVRGMAYHNVGYIHHLNKDFDKAIEAYKEALRNNPRDNDARYNLVLAQKQKKNEQQDKNSPQQDRQKSPDQDKKQQPPQKDQQQSSSPPPSQMSADNARQLMDLSRQAEQQTREKMQKAQQPRRRQLEKNW